MFVIQTIYFILSKHNIVENKYYLNVSNYKKIKIKYEYVPNCFKILLESE